MPDLSDVQAGDTLLVQVSSRYGTGYGRKLMKVIRRTATQAVCDGDMRYRLTDGHMIGDSFQRSNILRVATPEDIERLTLLERKRDLWNRVHEAARLKPSLDAVRAMRVTLEDLEAVMARLEAMAPFLQPLAT